MKLFAPDYYTRFSCTASKCSHNCCIGWEIDIDPETYAFYAQIGGQIGDEIRSCTRADENGASFILDENDRCPFLDKNGLCRLIIELGEDSLCDICNDHPRFRSFFSDRTEIGLGLCCEAAAELILGKKTKTSLVLLNSEDNDDCTADDSELELINLRNNLFSIVQDREFTIEERIENLCDFCLLDCTQPDLSHWADEYLLLERLDESWTQQLLLLKDFEEASENIEFEAELEQLLVYFLYRHLTAALEDGKTKERISFCILSTQIIKAVFSLQETQDFKTLCEIARLYSSEIEYSDENINLLLSKLEREA